MNTENTTATLEITSAFQLTGRHFYILGNLPSGGVKEGMQANFSSIGIDRKITILSIGIATRRNDDSVSESIGLGFGDLTEDEKKFLKEGSPFSTLITIE